MRNLFEMEGLLEVPLVEAAGGTSGAFQNFLEPELKPLGEHFRSVICSKRDLFKNFEARAGGV